MRIVSTERYGGGQRRGYGGVELRSKCGRRCCWMAQGQIHVRQEVQDRMLQVYMASEPFWWKMKEDRTRSTSAGTAKRSGPEVTHARCKATVGEKKPSKQTVGLLGSKKDSKTGCWNASSHKVADKRLDGQSGNSDAAVGKRWPGESSYKESLSCFAKRIGIRLDGTMIRQEFKASKAGDWDQCQSQCFDEGEDTGMPLRRQTGGR